MYNMLYTLCIECDFGGDRKQTRWATSMSAHNPHTNTHSQTNKRGGQIKTTTTTTTTASQLDNKSQTYLQKHCSSRMHFECPRELPRGPRTWTNARIRTYIYIHGEFIGFCATRLQTRMWCGSVSSASGKTTSRNIKAFRDLLCRHTRATYLTYQKLALGALGENDWEWKERNLCVPLLPSRIYLACSLVWWLQKLYICTCTENGIEFNNLFSETVPTDVVGVDKTSPQRWRERCEMLIRTESGAYDVWWWWCCAVVPYAFPRRSLSTSISNA